MCLSVATECFARRSTPLPCAQVATDIAFNPTVSTVCELKPLVVVFNSIGSSDCSSVHVASGTVDVCTISCNAGYFPAGYYLCSLGQWQGCPSCETAVPASATCMLPTVANAAIDRGKCSANFADPTVLQTCDVSCQPGFQLAGLPWYSTFFQNATATAACSGGEWIGLVQCVGESLFCLVCPRSARLIYFLQ